KEKASDIESASKRPLRPPYSEQQKFFIAYIRIIGKEYAICFPKDTSPQSKGGLTSVYYRIVYSRAYNFDVDFLSYIGYIKPPIED
ncbi:hypothetical protein D0861_03001, partial [Hortaea werneckii]